MADDYVCPVLGEGVPMGTHIEYYVPVDSDPVELVDPHRWVSDPGTSEFTLIRVALDGNVLETVYLDKPVKLFVRDTSLDGA